MKHLFTHFSTLGIHLWWKIKTCHSVCKSAFNAICWIGFDKLNQRASNRPCSNICKYKWTYRHMIKCKGSLLFFLTFNPPVNFQLTSKGHIVIFLFDLFIKQIPDMYCKIFRFTYTYFGNIKFYNIHVWLCWISFEGASYFIW